MNSELTQRELEILRLIAKGRTNKEIAAVLGITVRSVERHLTHIYCKLDVANRTEAAVTFLTSG